MLKLVFHSPLEESLLLFQLESHRRPSLKFSPRQIDMGFIGELDSEFKSKY